MLHRGYSGRKQLNKPPLSYFEYSSYWCELFTSNTIAKQNKSYER